MLLPFTLFVFIRVHSWFVGESAALSYEALNCNFDIRRSSGVRRLCRVLFGGNGIEPQGASEPGSGIGVVEMGIQSERRGIGANIGFACGLPAALHGNVPADCGEEPGVEGIAGEEQHDYPRD